MSFLNQLKSQASALQTEQSARQSHTEANTRLSNAQGFERVTTSYPAAQIQSAVLDEVAKLIVGQPSSFV